MTWEPGIMGPGNDALRRDRQLLMEPTSSLPTKEIKSSVFTARFGVDRVFDSHKSTSVKTECRQNVDCGQYVHISDNIYM